MVGLYIFQTAGQALPWIAGNTQKFFKNKIKLSRTFWVQHKGEENSCLVFFFFQEIL
jgi:hypothetical protein